MYHLFDEFSSVYIHIYIHIHETAMGNVNHGRRVKIMKLLINIIQWMWLDKRNERMKIDIECKWKFSHGKKALSRPKLNNDLNMEWWNKKRENDDYNGIYWNWLCGPWWDNGTMHDIKHIIIAKWTPSMMWEVTLVGATANTICSSMYTRTSSIPYHIVLCMYDVRCMKSFLKRLQSHISFYDNVQCCKAHAQWTACMRRYDREIQRERAKLLKMQSLTNSNHFIG